MENKPSLWNRIPKAAKVVSAIVGFVAAVVGILTPFGVFEGGSGSGQGGGGDTSEATGVTRAAWAREANDICREEATEFGQLPVADLFSKEQVTPEELNQVLAAWPDLMAIIDKKQNAIQAIPRPDADVAAIERMLTLWDQSAQSLSRAGEAAQVGQWPLFTQLYIDGAEVSARANETARQLGASECRGL